MGTGDCLGVNMKNGITLMHEHVILDLSKFKNDDCNYNDYQALIYEYKKLYDYGVRTIVDVTNIGMGRNIEYVQKIEAESGIDIISCTGFYQDKFFPSNMDEYSVEEVANIMIAELTNGIEDSDRKAKVIGEIGTSKDTITTNERKLFEAAIIAHNKTGAKITTHCTLGTMGLEQIEIFKNGGVNLSNVTIGHLDLTGDIEYILAVLASGAYVAFDTIGKNNYMLDEVRIEMLHRIIEAGYIDKIFFSMDITRKSNLEQNGGIGYKYMFETFIPECIKSGITKQQIEGILINNPQVFLGEK